MPPGAIGCARPAPAPGRAPELQAFASRMSSTKPAGPHRGPRRGTPGDQPQSVLLRSRPHPGDSVSHLSSDPRPPPPLGSAVGEKRLREAGRPTPSSPRERAERRRSPPYCWGFPSRSSGRSGAGGVPRRRSPAPDLALAVWPGPGPHPHLHAFTQPRRRLNLYPRKHSRPPPNPQPENSCPVPHLRSPAPLPFGLPFSSCTP